MSDMDAMHNTRQVSDDKNRSLTARIGKVTTNERKSQIRVHEVEEVAR